MQRDQLFELYRVVSQQVRGEKRGHHTGTAVDDAMMWAKREFKNLCDRPRDNPLQFCIQRHVETPTQWNQRTSVHRSTRTKPTILAPT